MRRGGEEVKRKRGIKIFSEQNAVMTKYPPGVCRAEGFLGKEERLGKGEANVSKDGVSAGV